MSKVSAAFVFDRDKILLFKRDNKPTIKDPDCWDILGGHVEEGEDDETALRRELKEEISINPKNVTYLQNIEDTWGSDTALYRVILDDEEVSLMKLGDEGQAIEFFELTQLNELKLTQNLKHYKKVFTEILHD